jgi:hypothetical protein
MIELGESLRLLLSGTVPVFQTQCLNSPQRLLLVLDRVARVYLWNYLQVLEESLERSVDPLEKMVSLWLGSVASPTRFPQARLLVLEKKDLMMFVSLVKNFDLLPAAQRDREMIRFRPEGHLAVQYCGSLAMLA